jgi:hypothetical protein
MQSFLNPWLIFEIPSRTLWLSFLHLITPIFASFSFRICGLPTAEILCQLENNQGQGAVDVALFPPDEEMTDEDSDEEDEAIPKDINHLGRGILTQQGELVMYNDNEELPDLTVVRKS